MATMQVDGGHGRVHIDSRAALLRREGDMRDRELLKRIRLDFEMGNKALWEKAAEYIGVLLVEVDTAREEGRREGFEKAREMAVDRAQKMADDAKALQERSNTNTPMGATMYRIAEAQWDVLAPLADDIRAMRDGAGDGPSFCRRPGCGHQWHKGPCHAAECACVSVWPPFRPEEA